MGVDGNPPVDHQAVRLIVPVVADERAGLTRPTQPDGLQPGQRDERETVVGVVDVHVIKP